MSIRCFSQVGSVVKEPAPCGPGPWGGDGGRPWDDGVFSGIKQIYLTRAEAICSIQIEYDRNGQSIWSSKHGGDGGITVHRVIKKGLQLKSIILVVNQNPKRFLSKIGRQLESHLYYCCICYAFAHWDAFAD